MILSPDQQRAIEVLNSGKNVFLTGCAGTGKTATLYYWLSTVSGKCIAVTASTGIAATHLGGQTVHAWSGAGMCDGEPEEIASKWFWRENVRPQMAMTDILVIDEVSMLDGDAFGLIDQLCRYAKAKHDLPFGGMQVILVGDMGQLAPVDEENKGYAFETDTWWDAGFTMIELTTVHRQADRAFAQVLREVRDGCLSPYGEQMLCSRVRVFDPERAPEAVRILTHNRMVDEINDRRLNSLPGEPSVYKSDDYGRQEHIDILDRHCLSPKVLRLKPGARVMFTKNDRGGLFVNGTLGVVGSIQGNDIWIMIDGRTVPFAVQRVEWTMNMGYEKGSPLIARRVQFPLRLAWAITVHKSQGCSLDRVSADLVASFAPGQVYVALSRARTLQGLNIERWGGKRSIQTHPTVLDFVNGRYILPRDSPIVSPRPGGENRPAPTAPPAVARPNVPVSRRELANDF